MYDGGLRVAIHTLGCKVNQYESEAIKEQFISAGDVIVGEDEPADVYIVNTCTVTNVADRKSRQYIRRMKRHNPYAMMVVTGCYAQVSANEIEELSEVDMIIGNDLKATICGRVHRRFLHEAGCSKVENAANRHMAEPEVDVLGSGELTEYEDMGVMRHEESPMSRAFIKIQDGCNRFCSYCKIPYARGNIRSRQAEDIIEEARLLVQSGYREIVLTGINTALYGFEDRSGGEYPLGFLISEINSIEGDFRVRLSSLEPNVVNVNDVRSLAAYDKLCHHLHLSIQSGSDAVLRRMNRNYTGKDYLKIVKALRDFDPYYGITTDIIVGFPGETDEDFADTVEMVRKAEFGRVHGFRYSPRKGTKAAEFTDAVAPDVKNERMAVLLEAAEESARVFNRRNHARIHRVLTEEYDGDYISGYTDNYIRTYIYDPAHSLATGHFYDVKLSGESGDGCFAELARAVHSEGGIKDE